MSRPCAPPIPECYQPVSILRHLSIAPVARTLAELLPVSRKQSYGIASLFGITLSEPVSASGGPAHYLNVSGLGQYTVAVLAKSGVIGEISAACDDDSHGDKSTEY